MSNTYNALIHAKQDGTGEEVANNKTGGDGSLYAPVTSIATPESGATSSKAYAVGEMFIRGGKLCTCIVAISTGDTLVKDTNYKEGSVGEVLTELNSNLYKIAVYPLSTINYNQGENNGSVNLSEYNTNGYKAVGIIGFNLGIGGLTTRRMFINNNIWYYSTTASDSTAAGPTLYVLEVKS